MSIDISRLMNEQGIGNYPYGSSKGNLQSTLKINIENLNISIKLIKELKHLNLDSETLDYVNRNQKVLLNNLNIARESKNNINSYSSNTYSSPESSSDGCYIATMAYGNYDNPQVMKLRVFRDEFLKKYFFGRIFISVYYEFSPILVNRLRNHKKINSIIRILLNKFIKLI